MKFNKSGKRFIKKTNAHSDDGNTLETSVFESLFGGQFLLSAQLIKPNYLRMNMYAETESSLASSSSPIGYHSICICVCFAVELSLIS